MVMNILSLPISKVSKINQKGGDDFDLEMGFGVLTEEKSELSFRVYRSDHSKNIYVDAKRPTDEKSKSSLIPNTDIAGIREQFEYFFKLKS